MHDTKARRFKVGWVVGAVRAALTIVESKAWLILQYFMHVGQVWGEEDHR